MKKLFALLVVFIVAKPALTQRLHPQNKQELIAACDRFMQAFEKGRYVPAFDSLKPYTVIEDYKLDTLAITSTTQMNSLSDTYGKCLSFAPISEKDVKASLVRLIYLLKFEKDFLKFRFILYNNGSGWTITHFTYDGETDDIFDDGVK